MNMIWVINYFISLPRVMLFFCVSGRLLSCEEKYPRVKTLIEQLRETCHLVPVSSCLDLGGPEIFRKIFDIPVWSLATRKSSTGTVVICGLENGSIIIFDLETGM